MELIPRDPKEPAGADEPPATGLFSNYMYFPRELREAIPARHSARCLKLTNISAQWGDTPYMGKRVFVDFQLEESGKLTGTFQVYADLNPEAARALAATLEEVLRQVHLAQV